jgi:site-specific DNA recombinase
MEVVIYCRYSSELQNPKSLDDQEREVKEGLKSFGVDVSNAIVISDAAISGTTTGREGFEQVCEMIRSGKPIILAVDDQSRFSRLNNAFALVTDLVFAGGRFISTGEHIDTNSPGWKLRVRVMELHHSTCSDETGHRVRRGQHGRVLEGLSAGDICYGYESFYLDPDAARACNGRGPKPAKGVRINGEQARWVIWVFEKFASGKSLNWIARELTRMKVPRCRRGKTRNWCVSTVRKMLGNSKYDGIWVWGRMAIVRDSSGRKKQVRSAIEKVVHHQRENLRIVAAELWQIVQDKLELLKKRTGMKPGDPSRAPKVHYSETHPKSIAQHLFVCGHCGGKTHHQGRGKHVYRACVNSIDGRDECLGRPRVPEERARKALLAFVSSILRGSSDWIDAATEEMIRSIHSFSEQVPRQQKLLQDELERAERRLENLLRLADSGAVADVGAFGDRLKQAESDVNAIQEELRRLKSLQPVRPEVPDAMWIRDRIQKLERTLANDESTVALLLRELVGSVRVFRHVPVGKKFGFHELRFRINGWHVIVESLRGVIPNDVLKVMSSEIDPEAFYSREFCLRIGGPTKMDDLAPRVAELKSQGLTWEQVAEEVGLSPGSAYQCWRRYKKALAANSELKRERHENRVKDDNVKQPPSGGEAA